MEAIICPPVDEARLLSRCDWWTHRSSRRVLFCWSSRCWQVSSNFCKNNSLLGNFRGLVWNSPPVDRGTSNKSQNLWRSYHPLQLSQLEFTAQTLPINVISTWAMFCRFFTVHWVSTEFTLSTLLKIVGHLAHLQRLSWYG